MTNYTEIEDYDCSVCEWSLHVEKGTWTTFPDQHQEILEYINSSIDKHIHDSHVQDNDTPENLGVKKAPPLYPIDKDISIYTQSPYLSDIDVNNSSLTIIE